MYDDHESPKRDKNRRSMSDVMGRMAAGTMNCKSPLPCACWLRVSRLFGVPYSIPQGSQNIRGKQEYEESDDLFTKVAGTTTAKTANP